VTCLSDLANDESPFSQWLLAEGHEDAFEKIMEAIGAGSAEFDMFEFERIPSGHLADEILEWASNLGLPATLCAGARSVTVDVSAGWDAYLASKSKSFRKRIRRERRNLMGTDHRWLRGAEEGGRLLERAFEVSVKSWKGSAGTAIGSTKAQRDFFRGLWDAFGPDGEMEVTVLEIGGVDAGSLISIRQGDTAYGMKVDFVEEFSDYSPGRMMVADFLERSAAAGLRTVDMLRQSGFTSEFSDEGYDLLRLRLFPRRSLPAFWYGLQERLRPVGRGWRRARRLRRRSRGAYVCKEQ
jgi:CelD/BcsL family acetyltransferase involved in cellulose biosynthesis